MPVKLRVTKGSCGIYMTSQSSSFGEKEAELPYLAPGNYWPQVLMRCTEKKKKSASLWFSVVVLVTHIWIYKEGARYKPLQSKKQTLGEREQELIKVIQGSLLVHQTMN